ncbi:hypothetical protein EDD16DRAFT_1071131 [Pisolithus croceorrhizus]|nr:hypothetical protein EDD16DRAFT_1071131 [Pisolithus croceorrhizus]
MYWLCVAITLGILVGLAGGKALIDPFNQVSKSVYIASVIFALFPPLLYDSILLVRLFALYPISTTPATTLLKIFAFPFCVKCARVIVLSIGLNEYVSSELTTVTLEEDEATAWFRNPKMTAEWGMQIADNLYSVSIFLYNLHVHTSSFKRAGSVAAQSAKSSISRSPILFSLSSSILHKSSVSRPIVPHCWHSTTHDQQLCNRHWVLFATLWFSGSEWVRTRNESLPGHMVFSPNPNFGMDPVNNGKSGITLGTTGLGTGADSRQSMVPGEENKYIMV